MFRVTDGLRRRREQLQTVAWRLAGLIALPCLRLLIRGVGFQRVHQYLWRNPPVSAQRAVGGNGACHAARNWTRHLDWAADRGVVRGTCLERSLLLGYLLRRQGWDVQLCFGAALRGDQCLGHAWLECQGDVVNDRADVAAAFTPFVAISSRSSDFSPPLPPREQTV